MATSSITANFRIDDPKAVRFLVRELCSNKPWRMPSVRVTSRHVSKAELERGIRATEAQLSEAMTDPEFRRECAEMDARYAAMELVESLLRSKSGIRKMNAYHDNYHRDFDIMVSLGENDEDSISRSSRDLVFA